MMHPDTRLGPVDEDIGVGVFATAPIPAGTITYARDALDVVIPPDSPLLSDEYYAGYIAKFAFREPNGEQVLGWDISKHVNHSCNPNTLSTGFGFEIAVRDIAAGEEITDDYGLLNIDDPMACACGSHNCRAEVRPGDFDQLYPEWDTQVREALEHLLNVPQPLQPCVDSRTWFEVIHHLNSGRHYRSVKHLYYGEAVRMQVG